MSTIPLDPVTRMVKAAETTNAEYAERLRQALGVSIEYINQDQTACKKEWGDDHASRSLVQLIMNHPNLKNFEKGNDSYGLVVLGVDTIRPTALTPISCFALDYYKYLAKQGEIPLIVFAGLHANDRSPELLSIRLNGPLGMLRSLILQLQCALGLQINYDFMHPTHRFFGSDPVSNIGMGDVSVLCRVLQLMLIRAGSLRRKMRITAIVDGFSSLRKRWYGKTFKQALSGFRSLAQRGQCGDFGSDLDFKYVLIHPFDIYRSIYRNQEYETVLEVKDMYATAAGEASTSGRGFRNHVNARSSDAFQCDPPQLGESANGFYSCFPSTTFMERNVLPVLDSLLLDPRHVGADLMACTTRKATWPGTAERWEEEQLLFNNDRFRSFEAGTSAMLVINNTEPLGNGLSTTRMSWLVPYYARKTRASGGIALAFVAGLHATLPPSDPYSGPTGLMRSLIMQLVIDFKRCVDLNHINDDFLRLVETGDALALCDLMKCVLQACSRCVAIGARENCHITCIIDGMNFLENNAVTYDRQEDLRIVYKFLGRVKDDVKFGHFRASTHFKCMFLDRGESLFASQIESREAVTVDMLMPGKPDSYWESMESTSSQHGYATISQVSMLPEVSVEPHWDLVGRHSTATSDASSSDSRKSSPALIRVHERFRMP